MVMVSPALSLSSWSSFLDDLAVCIHLAMLTAVGERCRGRGEKEEEGEITIGGGRGGYWYIYCYVTILCCDWQRWKKRVVYCSGVGVLFMFLIVLLGALGVSWIVGLLDGLLDD